MITDFELLISIKNQTNLEQIPLEYLRIELQDERTKEIALSKMFFSYEDGTTKSLGSDDYIKVIERKIHIINTELSRLERGKTKTNTNTEDGKKSAINRVLAFNNNASDEENVSDAMEKIEMILDKINDLLFVDSTPKQWELLLKGKVLQSSIILKEKVTIKDFKYFIKSLKNKVFRGRIYEDLGRANAFIFEGELLTGKQMQKVDESTDSKLKKQIDEIILYLD